MDYSIGMWRIMLNFVNVLHLLDLDPAITRADEVIAWIKENK